MCECTKSRVKCDGPVAVLQGEVVLLDLDVAGGPVGERLGVVGVEVYGVAVVLDGVGDRPRPEAPVPLLALLGGGQGTQRRLLAGAAQRLHEVPQRERGVRGEGVLPAAGAHLALLQPLVEAVLAEGVPARGLAGPCEVLHADGAGQDVRDVVKVNLVHINHNYLLVIILNFLLLFFSLLFFIFFFIFIFSFF